MKKRHPLVLLTFIAIVTTTFYACLKDHNGIRPQDKVEAVPQKQAQEIFSYAKDEIQSRLGERFGHIEPSWNLATPVSLDLRHNALYIPLSYDDSTGNYLHMIVIKDEGRVRSLLVEMQPDPSWYKEHKNPLEYKNLTGKLLFYSVNGRFYQGYEMENGSMRKEYTPTNELNSLRSLMARNDNVAIDVKPPPPGNPDPCAGKWGTFGCQELAEVQVVAHQLNNNNYVYINIPSSVYSSNPNGGVYSGYMWSPQTSGGGTGYLKPSLTSLQNQIRYKPFVLYDIPCSTIQAWINTAKTVVAQAQLNKLKQIAGQPVFIAAGVSLNNVAHLQDINNAYSTTVNMDYFPITIDKMPTVNNKKLTPSEFLNYIRININGFVNTSLSSFQPYQHYGTNDVALWNSSNPLGAVIEIDIAGPDNGSVIVSNCSASSWTFSTIYDPLYLSHPVSGHREVGYTQNANGSVTFYTRAVDRLTNVDATALQAIAGIPFDNADALWRSFQSKVTDYVKANGGTAKVGIPEIYRPNWQKVKDVLDGKASLNSLSKDCPTN